MNHLAAPLSADRAAERLAFARDSLGEPALTLERASEDASFRSYWRARGRARSAIVMDAPPARGSSALAGHRCAIARRRAARAGSAGAGSRTRFPADGRSRHAHLPAGARTTARWTRCTAMRWPRCSRCRRAWTRAGLPPYDEHGCMAELELMPTWFLRRHLGITIECDEWDVIGPRSALLINTALAQPRASCTATTTAATC